MNLRQTRKRRVQEKERAEADANAVRHGRTKGEKRRETVEAERGRTHLDGHRLEDDDVV